MAEKENNSVLRGSNLTILDNVHAMSVKTHIYYNISQDNFKPKDLRQDYFVAHLDMSNLDILKKKVAILLSENHPELDQSPVDVEDLYLYKARQPAKKMADCDTLLALTYYRTTKNIIKIGAQWRGNSGNSDQICAKMREDKMEGATEGQSLNESFCPIRPSRHAKSNGVLEELKVYLYDDLSESGMPFESENYIAMSLEVRDFQSMKADIARQFAEVKKLSRDSFDIQQLFHYVPGRPPKLLTDNDDVVLLWSETRISCEPVRLGIVKVDNTVKIDSEKMQSLNADSVLTNFTNNSCFLQPAVKVKVEPEPDTEYCNQRSDRNRNIQIQQSDLVANLNDLRVKDMYCDVILQCQGQVSVKGHRLILAASSPYFQDQTLYSEGWGVYHFDDVRSETMSLVLVYLYGNSIVLNKNIAKQVKDLAEKLQLKDLLRECESLVPEESAMEAKEPREECAEVGQEDKNNSSDDQDDDMKSPQSQESNESEEHRKRKYKRRRSLRASKRRRMEEALEKTWACNLCHKSYSFKCLLQNHQEKSHGIPKPKRKPKCASSKMSSKYYYAKKEYRCQGCEAVFSGCTDYMNHKRVSLECGTVMEACPVCVPRHEFGSKQRLRNHMAEVHKEEMLGNDGSTAGNYGRLCDVCLLYFPQGEIDLHRVRAHSIGDQFTEKVTCLKCDETFIFKEEYKSHMKLEHNMNVQYCSREDCDDILTRSGTSVMESHLVDKHGDPRYKCTECDFMSPLIEILRQHAAKQHKQLGCPICKGCVVKIRNYMRLYTHIMKRHGITADRSRVYVCQTCNYTSLRGNSLTFHIQTVHSTEKARCQKCGQVFKSKIFQERHQKVCGQKFFCSYCAREFNTKFGCQLHEKKHAKQEDEDKTFKCLHCHFSSWTKLDLISHSFSKHRLVLDSSIRVFTCEYCGYQTVRKSSLEKHYSLMHTESEKVKCPICGVERKDEINLKRHMHVHNRDPDVKPVSCPRCEYRSYTVNTMAEHMLSSHLLKGQKPFACNYCPYRSNMKGNVTKHIQVQHPGKDLLVHQLQEIPRRHDILAYLKYSGQETRTLEEFIEERMKKRSLDLSRSKPEESSAN